MRPHELLATAQLLIKSGDGNPSSASLSRAVSSGYYALFHHLAGECADFMVGTDRKDRASPAWRQVYRSLEHGFAKSQCKQKATIAKFPDHIQDFAALFVDMQVKRHDADYDPDATFLKSDVIAELLSVENTILMFQQVNARDRRAFCVFVLLKDRKS